MAGCAKLSDMNKPNAINRGASSTADALREDTADTAQPGAGEQAYENSVPGTVGNAPGAHKATQGARVEAGMMGIAKTATEAGVPDSKETQSGKQ